MRTLFEQDKHKIVMFSDMSSGEMVQANQFVVVHEDEGLLLDPGGHKVYTQLVAEISRVVPAGNIRHIFLSHQDPDIVAALNGWLLMTDATAYLPEIWARFVTHFGIDEHIVKKVKQVGDDGGTISMNGYELQIVPAHYLHSAGNFQLYDPQSKILFSGDLGVSLGMDYEVVEHFENHIQYMEAFHKRFIPSKKAITHWLDTIEKLELDIETIAPQHGAIFTGKESVETLLQWLKGLDCGLDLLE